MSEAFYVHVPKARMPSLAAWRARIDACSYPLAFLEEFDPLAGPGCVRCNYDGQAVEIEYYLDEHPEIPAPRALNAEDRVVASFHFNYRDGEIAKLCAVAAATALCVEAGGVLESDSVEISAKRARSWAKQYLDADNELAKRALAFPHPDEVEDEPSPNAKRPWWKLW